MKNSPITPRSTKKKKTILSKKIEEKRTIPDIRKFWKTMDNGNNDIDTSRRQEETTMTTINNKSMKKNVDPGKLYKDVFKKTECAKAECSFNEARVCRIHGCEAEKIVVKVSRFKKNVGFVKECVTKLRCRDRTKGMESPRISTVDILPGPALLRTNSGEAIMGSDTGLALETQGDSDWMEHRLKTECSVVIGDGKDSMSALPGDVKTLT